MNFDIFSSKHQNMAELVSLTTPTTAEMQQQAVRVVEEMLIDRGFTIQYIDRELTNEDQSYFLKANKINDWVICCMNEEEKVNIADIKKRLAILNREGASRCIIIYRSSVTSSAKNSIETFDFNFELFGLHELQLNITRHRLVPRHCHVTEEEKTLLDKDFKGKLPTLLTTDPVCRYFAFTKGEYVRIHRKDGSMMYRVVK